MLTVSIFLSSLPSSFKPIAQNPNHKLSPNFNNRVFKYREARKISMSVQEPDPKSPKTPLPDISKILEAGAQKPVSETDKTVETHLLSAEMDKEFDPKRSLSPLENFRNGDPHVASWHGQWTRWNPKTFEMITTFQSIRSLQFDDTEQRLSVNQQNIYCMEDGNIVTRPPWKYGVTESQTDGIAHEAIPGMRAFFFPGGDGVYLSKKWNISEEDQGDVRGPGAGIELFFVLNEKVRVSVGFLYAKNGSVVHIAAVREDAREVTELKIPFLKNNSYWSESNDIVKEANAKFPADGILKGEEKIIEFSESSGMSITEREGTWKGFKDDSVCGRSETSLDKSDYLMVHLPDNITLFFPEKVEKETPFECTAYLLVGEEAVREMRAYINAEMVVEGMLSGRYYMATHE